MIKTECHLPATDFKTVHDYEVIYDHIHDFKNVYDHNMYVIIRISYIIFIRQFKKK